MKPHLYWLIFLGAISCSVILYTGHTFYLVWRHYSLNEQTLTKSMEWDVVSNSDDDFVPRVMYSYEVDQKLYQGQEFWNTHYLNDWAAKESINRLNKKPLVVWYDFDHPKISSLQKKFPYKESFYTVFLWMLGFYFYFLGLYVKNRY